jgi:hypothetical protein
VLPEDLIWGAKDGPGMGGLQFNAFVGTGGSCTQEESNAQLTYVRMVRRTPPPRPLVCAPAIPAPPPLRGCCDALKVTLTECGRAGEQGAPRWDPRGPQP